MMAFRYSYNQTKPQSPPKRGYEIAAEPEILSGQFQGKTASDDEERFLLAVSKQPNVQSLWFRFTLGAKYMPGWLELDALVKTFHEYKAFEIDDMTFVHRGEREMNESKVKDLKRIEMLAKLGVAVREIRHVDAALLTSKEQAVITVRNLQL
jgi:hypothetical protein